jgi:choline dehydrogenase-like flavoprotein
LGNPGWGWHDFAPYLRKFHTLNLPENDVRDHLKIAWIDESIRGDRGPIQAIFGDTAQNPLGKALIETFENFGAAITQDPFSGRSTGCFSCPSSVDPNTRTRSYSASAYFARASKRPNLEVITGVTVKQLIIEADPPVTARGVIFNLNDGSSHTIHAKKEVILAAGAFGSPKLLELSGIGDKDLLGKLGIPLRVHNPYVGENLQDHVMTGISFEVADGVQTGDPLLRQEPEVVDFCMKMYQDHKAGPLASGSLTTYAFMPVQEVVWPRQSLEEALRESGANVPNSGFARSHHGFVANLLKNPSEASGAIFAIPAQVNLHNGPRQIGLTTNPQPGNYLSLGTALLHPLSCGSSHIASSDTEAQPVIDPRYFSNPLDLEIFARQLMTIEQLAKTSPLEGLLKSDGRRAQPGNPRINTVEQAKDYIRQTALSNNHPVGTCAMLPQEKGGVVDSRLRVYGVKGLRIVDSSVMPVIPRCNIQTVVYGVAEKAADLIKEDFGLF